jgi:hypothetical protein
MKRVATALVALTLGCSSQAAHVADDDNSWATVVTGFRLLPESGDEEKSILGAIYAGAKQFKMDCQGPPDPHEPVCTNLVEILRRGMPRGNMELYVEREGEALHVFLVGDGRGRTCGAIQLMRARLGESVAAARIKVEAKDSCNVLAGANPA